MCFFLLRIFSANPEKSRTRQRKTPRGVGARKGAGANEEGGTQTVGHFPEIGISFDLNSI